MMQADDVDVVMPAIPLVTKTAHWPSGPVRVCDRHAAVLSRLADVLGFVLHNEDLPEDSTAQPCSNCLQELAQDSDKFLAMNNDSQP